MLLSRRFAATGMQRPGLQAKRSWSHRRLRPTHAAERAKNDMPTYPVELRLTRRPVLVVGGGAVAARKVTGLRSAEAQVRVVSLEFVPELLARQDIVRETRPYASDCLTGVELVFACTESREVNATVAADARARGIWCNVSDAPGECDFFIPAVLRQGDLTVSVGTGGAAPRVAAILRDRLESHLGPQWAILIEELGRARAVVMSRVSEPGLRRQILEALCTECSLKLLDMRGREAWRDWFERVMAHRLCGLEGIPDIT